jgi:hypothetical protein
MGIADIYEIMGEYGKAAETYDRIIDLLIAYQSGSEDGYQDEERKCCDPGYGDVLCLLWARQQESGCAPWPIGWTRDGKRESVIPEIAI